MTSDLDDDPSCVLALLRFKLRTATSAAWWTVRTLKLDRETRSAETLLEVSIRPRDIDLVPIESWSAATMSEATCRIASK